MHPGPLRDVLTFVVGIVTGVLSAAFGVGGAVVSTPGIRVLGASARIAVGTTLPSIFPSAATGTIRYTREHLVLWRAVFITVPFGVACSVVGSLLSGVIPGHGHVLMVMTAALLGITAWRMALQPRAAAGAETSEVIEPSTAAEPSAAIEPSPAAGPSAAIEPSAVALGAIGAAAGLLSGLLGVGGGIVMVPAFSELLKLPVKTTVATSLVCVGIFAVPGTLTHALAVHDISWRLALLLAVGVVPGARIGAARAIRASDHRLRLAVAVFLCVIAIIYGGGEILALR